MKNLEDRRLAMTMSHARLLANALKHSKSKSPSPILYSDNGIIIINKPSGLVCQSDKSLREEGPNSFDSLLQDLKTSLKLTESPKQVHRLDKFTTGALVLAKNERSARELHRQFSSHTIKKTYLALVRGGRKSFPELTRGTVNAPLKINGERVIVDEREGKAALTDWELLGSSEKVPLSLVRLTLHSGIKHQLRVHLAKVLQTPVLGDTFYSHSPPHPSILNLVPKNLNISLQKDADGRPCSFLHASSIVINRFRPKRTLLSVTAPLTREFLTVCGKAELTQYLTDEEKYGGIKVDGEKWDLTEPIPGLDGMWLWKKENISSDGVNNNTD